MEKMESFWEKVKSNIKQTLPDHSYRMWIEPVKLLAYDEQQITLSSPNAYYVKRLKDNYLPAMEQEFQKLGCSGLQIGFKIKNGQPSKTTRKSPDSGSFAARAAYSTESQQLALPGLDVRFESGRMFKKGYTFNDFVVGDNSNFAYSASLSLAQGKMNGAGILYLLAKTGLGKSHLSQAVGHHIITNSVSSRVYYVTAEDFTNEMIFSLRNGTIEQFKEKYRKKCDVLILEDVHFLAGKKATQNELAMTLDYLLDADKKIIFSGCDVPENIPKLDNQLKSRLTSGLITEIEAPDFRTRVKILKRKSKNFGYDIPMPVTEFIAQELCDDVRQLESGLFGVAAKAQLMNRKIDVELAKGVLANISSNRQRVSVETIKKLVCQEFSITESDIVSSSRKKKIVKPRQMAIYLSRKYTDQSIKKIGTSFNRYHATAIYAINSMEKEIKQKSILFEQLKYLSQKIESGKF